ncbi:VanZ family protein [Jeongeupia sp. USM3]|uniref:VanZ family protein n=1 Tax=Jeongeupia sp. USM3 TaxID=1906741 RepID=UPI00089DD777|nr:VanZ family protein [Jeongeupia sp. USM3]AOY01351.1 hypothetical protein BJP62_13370 [Jeongeupia sp. USM3]
MRFPPISYLAHQVAQSRVSQYFFYCYLLVILTISFYPFSGWRYTGEPIFAFYTYPLPYYFTLFDNLVNVLAYVPLGVAVGLMARRRWYAWPLAALVGTLLSGSIEFVQQFLPDRVASNLDMLSNGFGASIGGLMSLVIANRRWQRAWQVFRHSHLAESTLAEWGLVWLGLWFVTQFDPSVPFLGVVVAPRGIPQPFESPLADPALFLSLLEAGGMMLHLVGVALFVSVLVKHVREVPAAIRLTLLAGLVVKLAFAGMLLQPAQFFAWINRNIVIGGLVGVLLLWGLWQLRRRLRALVGALALAAAVAVGWIWPLSPQLSATLPLFRWHYGHLTHFNGLASVIGDVWPYGAVLILLGAVLARPDSGERWP